MTIIFAERLHRSGSKAMARDVAASPGIPMALLTAALLMAILAILAISLTEAYLFDVVGLAPRSNFFVWRVLGRFAVDGEGTFPAWLSSAMMLLCALLLLYIGSASRRRGADFARHWQALGLLFLMLSIDEAVSFHEILSRKISDLLDTSGLLFYGWVLAAIPVVILLAALYLPLILSLTRRIQVKFVLSAAIYVGGALGFEMLSGLEAELHGENSLLYHVLTHAEEGLEMIGLLLFLNALLDHVRGELSAISVRIV